MKNWLADPITRAEAIGWALAVPACAYSVLTGYGIVQNVQAFSFLLRSVPEEVPQTLITFDQVGAVGMGVLFGVLAVLAIVTQFGRQRSWVRLAAPIVCALLAFQVASAYGAAWTEFSTEWQVNHADRLAEYLGR